MPGRGLTWALALLLLASPTFGDPRIRLVELQISDRDGEALAALEDLAAEDAATARRLGLDYLRGHLLLRVDRRREALESFAATMSSTPELSAYSRYRLALEQESLGHPEVAAGLVAKLLASEPPRSLAGPSMRLLARAIDEGADCRLLLELDPVRFRRDERRLLLLSRAECARRAGNFAAAEKTFLALLEERRDDVVALAAARRVAAAAPEKKAPRTHLLLGLAFYEHREFPTAIEHLARTMVQLRSAPDVSRSEVFDLRYALARSFFWEGRYDSAATAFESLAADTTRAAQRAQALYQQGRCLELDGRWEAASATFHRAYAADPRGRWADGALIADLRLHWRSGQEDPALESYTSLARQRHFKAASRALLFLASSDLVQGRYDRADAWLAAAERLGRDDRSELAYWQGRLAEGQQQPAAAVAHYLESSREDPYRPFARAARRRLRGPGLAAEAERTARRLAGSTRADDLQAAWLLLEPSDRRRAEVEKKLLAALEQDPRASPFLELRIEPAATWPLWQSSTLGRPEEMLLALGLFDEGSAVVLRYFPVARPALAFTGSVALAHAGNTGRSLYIAEILSQRVPSRLPHALLPPEFRRLLFPFPYRPLILERAAAAGIDPYLLAAIIREESHFDPLAFSTASARGLTQFVLPTARSVAERIGLGGIEPQDLERPEISIALGAAYLHQLSRALDGDVARVIAAYNAGERQAEHWRRYCYSTEREEYLTKIAFRETRDYLLRVLSSRAHYRELYPPEEAAE